MNDELIRFRETIDADKGFESKRKILTVVCIAFLAMNLTGASIEEANTFLFKIKLENHAGLGYFFLFSIICLAFRYYAYAQPYHSRLDYFWRMRLMRDWRVLSRDPETEETSGLLSLVYRFAYRGEPETGYPEYIINGFFRRSITYSLDDDFENYEMNKSICPFNSKMTIKNYIKILYYEFRYQFEAQIKYRESLDLHAPYLLSSLSIGSYFFKDSILPYLK